MKNNNYAKLTSKMRKPVGATLALVASCILALVSLCAAFFYIAESIYGGKELDNATDAGALNAARSIMSVSLTPAQVNQQGANSMIPQAFICAGVDANGNGAMGVNSSGQPVDANNNVISPIYYNIAAYNRACGITLIACLNAAADGGQTAINNANYLLGCLHSFSNNLAQDIQASPVVANAFAQLAGSNPHNLPTKLFGSDTTTTMVPQSLQLACDPTTQQASNIYLSTAYTATLTSPAQQAWLAAIQSSQTASDPAANGAKLIKGGVSIQVSALNPSLVGTITPVPFEVGQVTHLISSETFNNQCQNIVTSIAANNSPAYTPPPSGTTMPVTIWASNGSFVLQGSATISDSGTNGQFALQLSPALAQSFSSDFSQSGISGGVAGNCTVNIGDNAFNFVSPSTPSSTMNISFMCTLPSLTEPFPYNTVSVKGLSGGVSTDSLSLTTLSTALANTLKEYPVLIPPNGYVRIINGQDFVQAMNGHGYSTSQIRQMNPSYSNIELEAIPSAPITLAYDATCPNPNHPGQTNPDIFELFSWGNSDDFIVVGTNVDTGVYKEIQKKGIYVGGIEAPPSGYPQNNYDNVVDGSSASVTNPPMPFIWAYKEPQTVGALNTSTSWAISHFGAWIDYNTSNGPDGLGHKPGLDPLINYGGSPAIFYSKRPGEGPGFIVRDVSGTPYGRITSTNMQRMTLASALKIKDIVCFHDGANAFTPNHPQWMDLLLPVIGDNYGVPYIPYPVQGSPTKSSYTAMEYAKAQVVGIFAGVGLQSQPGSTVYPSQPGIVWLPMENAPGSNLPYSGMKDFIGSPAGQTVPFGPTNIPTWPNLSNPSLNPWLVVPPPGTNNGILQHHPWLPSSGDPTATASVNAFESASTPLQYLYEVNVLNNGGQFNGSDATFSAIMQGLLTVVQQMNPNHTMQDVVNVLCNSHNDVSPNLGLNQTWFLYDYNGVLKLSATPPPGDANLGSDGSNMIQYSSTYPIGGGWVNDNAKASQIAEEQKSIIDTAAYYQRGDCNLHDAPYRGISAQGNDGGFIYSQDVIQWNPGTGAGQGSVNFGDLMFYETVGPSIQFSSIN